MNRKDFYRQFAAENDISHMKSKDICVAMFDLLFRCINEEERVYIKGFGTFKKKMMKEHLVSNFHGGDPILIPAREKIMFEPYKGIPVTKEDEDEDDED